MFHWLRWCHVVIYGEQIEILCAWARSIPTVFFQKEIGITTPVPCSSFGSSFSLRLTDISKKQKKTAKFPSTCYERIFWRKWQVPADTDDLHLFVPRKEVLVTRSFTQSFTLSKVGCAAGNRSVLVARLDAHYAKIHAAVPALSHL